MDLLHDILDIVIRRYIRFTRDEREANIITDELLASRLMGAFSTVMITFAFIADI
ncbi:MULTISPECIES: hypothetical protein [Sporosarcina]|uniref:hypothetical protein n=1 Tax=Sporosarcina TaxID=1569 RepID=UPI0012F47B50|nr:MULTISPECIES: hypothetical protein [Sporosarcina]